MYSKNSLFVTFCLSSFLFKLRNYTRDKQTVCTWLVSVVAKNHMTSGKHGRQLVTLPKLARLPSISFLLVASHARIIHANLIYLSISITPPHQSEAPFVGEQDFQNCLVPSLAPIFARQNGKNSNSYGNASYAGCMNFNLSIWLSGMSTGYFFGITFFTIKPKGTHYVYVVTFMRCSLSTQRLLATVGWRK